MFNGYKSLCSTHSSNVHFNIIAHCSNEIICLRFSIKLACSKLVSRVKCMYILYDLLSDLNLYRCSVFILYSTVYLAKPL